MHRHYHVCLPHQGDPICKGFDLRIGGIDQIDAIGCSKLLWTFTPKTASNCAATDGVTATRRSCDLVSLRKTTVAYMLAFSHRTALGGGSRTGSGSHLICSFRANEPTARWLPRSANPLHYAA